MRYFELLGIQHIILFVFPTLIFMILFYLGITHSHFRRKNSKERLTKIVHNYPHGLESRNAPFPLILILIISGIIIWIFLYTLGTGILGVKI
jgi:uncharacterized membrane protein YbaN (DUF454 family)